MKPSARSTSTLELLHADFDVLKRKYADHDPTPENLAAIKADTREVLEKHFHNSHLIGIHVLQEEHTRNWKISFIPFSI